jgi:glycosyltransferase involved in cell wall biosynthesis
VTSESEIVDVVMCANRISPFLGETLDSLRAQTYRQWRLIFVDDGSGQAQDLARIIGRIPASRLIHQPPAGIAAARNAGIRAGQGEIITFLDDDDLWPPDRLSATVAILAQQPTAIGAFGDGVYIDEEGRSFGGWSTPPAPAEDFLRGTAALPRITTLSLRRTALSEVGLFTDGLRLSEDLELTLRAVRHGELAHTGTVLVRYRRHSSNVTNTDWRLLHRAGHQAIAANVESARSTGNDQHLRLLRENRRRYDRAAASGGLGRVISEARARSYRQAVAELWDSLILSPVGFAQGAAARLRTWSRHPRE